MGKFLQGYFKPINPSRYEGDPTNIIYRSSWELKLLSYFDTSPAVISYSSEEFYIPYRCKTDNKMHRYFVDFKVKLKDKENKIKTLIIEIKPYRQTLPPVKPKEQTAKLQKRFINECLTYAKNQSKWEAAKKYAKERGMDFIIMTEQQLFGAKQ